MKKRLLSFLCCLSMVVCSNSVYAQEYENDIDTVLLIEVDEEKEEKIHVLVEDKTRGKKKPGIFASTHDLSVNDYNYQLTNFGATLFTEKWLKSSSGRITVYLENFTVLESYGGTSDKITFHLCDSSGRLSSATRTVVAGNASVTWININPDKKYYIEFEVPTNGNRYSGSGNITD